MRSNAIGNPRLCCAILVATLGWAVAPAAYAVEAAKAAEEPGGKLSLKVDLALPTSEKDPGGLLPNQHAPKP